MLSIISSHLGVFNLLYWVLFKGHSHGMKLLSVGSAVAVSGGLYGSLARVWLDFVTDLLRY